MRYPASEKLEIIRLVEGSHLPTKRTLDKLGVPRATFYRWYDRYLSGGPEALEDRSPKPSRVKVSLERFVSRPQHRLHDAGGGHVICHCSGDHCVDGPA